jgi:hypothetical protein
MMHVHYMNCLVEMWEPNIVYKGHAWIVVTFVVFWMQSTKPKNDSVIIHGY